MMRILIVTIFLGVLTVTEIPAQPDLDFYVKAEVQTMSGQTDYTTDIEAVDPVTLEYRHVKSLLEFPLDVMMYGGTAGMRFGLDEQNEIQVQATVLTNAGDPGDKMTDFDWDNRRTGVFEMVSYTESSARMSSVLIDAKVAWTFIQSPRASVAAVGGFRYQRIEQDIVGIEGWQLDSTGNRFSFNIPDIAGLFYRITYKIPQFGFRAEAQPLDRTNLGLTALWTPFLFDDFDDHLLRNREAEGDGSGSGFISELAVSIDLGAGRTRPYVGLFGAVTYLNAKGDQTQYWYGNDPITPDYDDTGDLVTGIPHDVESTQLRFGGNVGVRF